ncbi:tRNA pseudouridine(38-40) synthase TruA [soil metagenome]
MSWKRYKMTLAYRGTRYHGWQFQWPNYLWKGPQPKPGHGIPTIQETVSRALVEVLRHPVNLVGSSRTDSGVHAKGQLAHFDTDKTQIPYDDLRRAINHALPDDIIVRSVGPAGHEDFNAIFWTIRKRYQYFIWHALDREVFNGDLCWHRWKPMDIDAMRDAAQRLVGEHDFRSFARPGHGRGDTIRNVHACEMSYRPPRLVIAVEGGGFLWHQVRIMVGTLVEVGLGRFTPDDISLMLRAKDRRVAGSTAPPHGLYLQWIRTRDAANASTNPSS